MEVFIILTTEVHRGIHRVSQRKILFNFQRNTEVFAEFYIVKYNFTLRGMLKYSQRKNGNKSNNRTNIEMCF